MVIVGITGAIGHGKSSLAEALMHHQPEAIHIEAYRLVAEVADAWHAKLKEPAKAGDYQALNTWIKTLPAIIKKVVHANTTLPQLRVRPQDIAADPLAYQKLFQHLDALKLDPKLSKDKISDTNKASYRPVLQWLGGYLVTKVGPTIWWDEIIRRAQKAAKNGNQLAILGGVRYPGDAKVVHQAGGKIIQIKRPDMPEADILDPTERERQNIKPDVIVINNGSLADLDKLAKMVIEDLQKNRVKPKYATKNTT